MAEPYEDFADQLGRYLGRAGFTQQELAHKIGMHRNTIVKWMNRASRPASRGQVLRVADELFLDKEERKALLQAASFALDRWPTEVWMVPMPRDMFFTGRDEVFRSLREQLIPGSTTALTQAISGLGGIGKTHTAVEYAYRFHRDYEAVLWLQADSWETLVSACVQLADELALPEQQEADQVVAEVQYWLRKHHSWLLVLDDVEHPQDILSRFVPTQHHGSVLLTTRIHDVEPLAQTQVLPTMSEEEGVLFLLRRTKKVAPQAGLDQAGTTQQEEARQIWLLMDGLPLALDQAGAYILEAGCSFWEYRERYVRRRAELLARRGKRFIGHEASVATTFSLAFERVEAFNPTAADLLRACALLASEAIPEEIFREGAQHLGPFLAAGRASWDEAIGVLHDYSLVQRSTETHTLTIHRLVQAVLRDTMDTPTFRLWASRVVDALEALWPEREDHAATRFERLLAHALNGAELIEQCHLTSRAATQLLYQTGVYLAEHARYAEAEALYLQCLRLRKRALGSDYPEVAYPLRGLAELYHMQGNYPGAEPLYQQALHLWEQALEPEPRQLAGLLGCIANLAREQGKYGEAEALYQRALCMEEQVGSEARPALSSALQGLAELYHDEGRYGEAEALYQRALHTFEQVLDPDHPRIAPLLTNLANLYVDEGKFHEAEPLYQRTIRIQDEAFGPEHHQLAHALNSLANLYLEQENYPEAELLYGRALRIYELAVGPTSAQVAAPLNNLGRLYQKQGKYGEAEALCLRALHIREQALGFEHRDVATSLDYIAELYCDQGKYREAEPLYQRALRIREQALGLDHPELAFPLHGLGDIYCDQGRYEEAEPLYRRALSLWDQRQDAPQALLITLLEDLAQCCREQGKYREAEPLYQRALHLQEQVLGSDSPQLVSVLNSLAKLYQMQGNYPAAEPFYQRALHIQEQTLARDHPDVARQLDAVAGVYADQKKYTEAEPLYQRALRIQEQALGHEHPDVAAILNNLAELYRLQGRDGEAEPLYQRAIRLWEASREPEHLSTAQGLNNLALIYTKQRKYKKAKQLHRRALRLREQALGPEHLEVAKSFTNLAILYSMQGKYLEAELLVMRALDIVERTEGPRHPQALANYRFYAAILRAMDREEEAMLAEARAEGQEKAEEHTLQQEHALQYQLVHERLSDLIERAAANARGAFAPLLREWEEAVLKESHRGEAFALYGLPPRTVPQLVLESRLHEGRNPSPWTDEGSERVEERSYLIDVDQNPFDIAIDDSFESLFLPLNMALRLAWGVTQQRFFTEEGMMKQPDNPECRRIHRGIVSATYVRHFREEGE